jgi:membrane-bound lytic murein transglycosylase B
MRVRIMLAVMMLSLGLSAKAASDTELGKFAAVTAKKHKLDKAWVLKTLQAAKVKQSVRDAFKRTAESKTWKEYRPIFVKEKRAAKGRRFAAVHAAEMARAEHKYGVPAAIIGAIIGVETFYGTYTGKHRVLDSLVSLAFYDWRRRKFFASELQQFLLLASEGHVDPLTIKGSYAGAMGLPQFISSSYRAYAVDFDADGKRDLLKSRADAIGSVAAYLQRHGWQPGKAIAMPLKNGKAMQLSPYKKRKKPAISVGALRKAGAAIPAAVPGMRKAMILKLNGAKGAEYWLVFKNFYVITTYNHSPLYAMAVNQLSELLARRP